MNGIFKYLPHVIIVLLLGLFIFGILKGCQNLQSTSNDPTTTVDEPVDEEGTGKEANLDDLFEEEDPDSLVIEEPGPDTAAEGMDEPEDEGFDDLETDDRAPSETDLPGSGTPRYLVIAGSFIGEANAKREMGRLQDLGYPEAEVVEFDLSQYYSLCAGRFTSLREARLLKGKLKNQHNIEAYVHRMRGKKVDNY